jgi:hypothetical protein
MLRDLLQRWKLRRNARIAAMRCFRQSGGKWPIRSMTRVVAADDSGIVVRICSGFTMPERRQWFRVLPDGSVVGVCWEEAHKLGETPWR